MMIGRELAHFRYRHLSWRFWLMPSGILPLLYPAWQRATEYTADRTGLRACGSLAAAERAMYVTAVGGRMGRQVGSRVYRGQLRGSGGFWMTLSYLMSGGPAVAWRVWRLVRAAGGADGQIAGPRKSILATILCSLTPGMAVGRGAMGAAATPVLILAVVMLVVWLVPAIAMARFHARGASAMTDMYQLSRATMVYAMEHNDRLPATRAELLPYTSGDVERLYATSDRRAITYIVDVLGPRVPAGPGVSPRPWHLSDLPTGGILFYQDRGSRVIVARTDGTVMSLSREEFLREMRRTLELTARRGM
jgi:hypothetical protein